MADSTIDTLTSAALNYLREHWWNEEFIRFLQNTMLVATVGLKNSGQ